MLNFHQLTTFVTVISEGSMTQAADKLYLTQPAVSQQIRQLEEHIGVELLVRGVRQVKPTLQGEVLFEYSKKILQLAQQAESAVKAIGAHLKGQIRVGTLNSLGLYLFGSTVSRLMRYNPELQLKVEYGSAAELVKQFQKGALDVIIVPDLEKEYSLEISKANKKFLQQEEMWLVTSAREANFPRHIKISEMSEHPIVQFSGEYHKFNNQLASSLNSQKIVFESSNVGTLKRVVETGLGWGFLPSHSIKKQVRSGRLNRVQVEDYKYEFEIFYYSTQEESKLELLEAFYQSLQGQEKS